MKTGDSGDDLGGNRNQKIWLHMRRIRPYAFICTLDICDLLLSDIHGVVTLPSELLQRNFMTGMRLYHCTPVNCGPCSYA